MKDLNYEVIVIGSGPAGEGAAMKAAKSGLSVAVIEKHETVGGVSCHYGTIPSKVLRQSIQEIVSFRNNPIFNSINSKLNITYDQLLKRSNDVIEKQIKMRSDFYRRNNIEVIQGHAKFVDGNSVEVLLKNKKSKVFKGNAFIIATGSSPYHPSEIDFNHQLIFDSNSILQMSKTPRSITIYGAGVIGCEYASFFRNLGVKVKLINTHTHLLNFLDDEITDALGYHFRDQGVTLYSNEKMKLVEYLDNSICINLESGKQVKSDCLLWANGRSGNTDNLGLEKIGIKVNSRKQIEVNGKYQTTVPHIYAAGDVIGYPALASASFDQGRFAISCYIGKDEEDSLNLIPTGIYTSPEISSVGKTEKELTAEKIPYEIGHSMFKNLARAQIIGTDVGMLKILFHRDTLKVLGVHCFGYDAAEIIHIGQIVMNQNNEVNSLKTFITTTFNYPTMAEAYRIAALNGLNRL